MGKAKNYSNKQLAIIVISLVPESKTVSPREIEKEIAEQIRKDCSIPFCAEVEEIVVGDFDGE
jgi:translation elongation factor EF-1beta